MTISKKKLSVAVSRRIDARSIVTREKHATAHHFGPLASRPAALRTASRDRFVSIRRAIATDSA